MVLRLQVLGLSGFRLNVARHVGVSQCARTSGQSKSSTGIDGGPLPVEQPANYPLTSLSSAPASKVPQKSRHSTRMFRRIHHLPFLFSAFDFPSMPTLDACFVHNVKEDIVSNRFIIHFLEYIFSFLFSILH